MFSLSAVALTEDQLRGLCIGEGAEGDCRVTDFKDYSTKKPMAAPCCDADTICVPYHPSLTGKCMKKGENPFVAFLKRKLDQNGDGTASKEEVEMFVASGSSKGMPVYNAAAMSPQDIVASIMAHDDDDDGRISASELLAVFW